MEGLFGNLPNFGNHGNEEEAKKTTQPKEKTNTVVMLKNNTIEGIRARLSADKRRMGELAMKIATLSALLENEAKHYVAVEK